MKFRFHLSIRAKFLFILGIVILIIVSIGAFSYYSLNRVLNYNAYTQALDQVEIEYLQLRKHEQHFFLRYAEEIDFYKTGENKYIDKFNHRVENLKRIMSDLRENPITQQLSMEQNLANLNEYSYSYQNLFTRLTNIIKERGVNDYGLVGKMNSSAEKAYQSTDSPVFREYLLMLRKEEKDFFLREDVKHFRNYTNQYNKLIDYFDFVGSTEKRFLRYLEDYKNYLANVRILSEEIGYTAADGLRGEMRRQIRRIEPELDIIKKVVNEARQETIKSTIITFLIFISFIIIFVFVFIGQFLISVVGPVKQLREFIRILSKGDLPEKELHLTNRDEIAQMADAVNELINGLKKTTKFATAIGQGNFKAEFKPLSDKDDLGLALLDMRDNLNQAKIDEEARNVEANQRKWTNEGLTKFAELLRQNFENYDDFTYEIISELVQYVGANQGALFLYNDTDDTNQNIEDKYLQLTSAYAYDRRKYLEKKVYPGEGLVGTCALEKQTIYLTNLPQDYIAITSGLGEAMPKSLLVVPLQLNDEVYGIIEIAGLSEIKKYEIEFVEKIAESISSTLQTVKINAKTARLLAQSRRQAEEMAAQEEEMRQNLEELQATQEERSRREAEMRGILEAIDASSLLIEMDENGVISEINEKYLALFNKTYEQAIGQNYWKFIMVDMDETDLAEFWRDINRGIVHETLHHIVVAGRDIWLTQTYTPINDSDDNLYKVLNLANDITETKIQQEELLDQAEQMAAQEEEMKQNFEELQATQEEMERKQKELEQANARISANEQVLRKALDKAREKEREIAEKNQALESNTEELKQNMEELFTTQEELAKQEAEVRARIEVINQTNLMVSFALDGLFIEPNQLFCELLGYAPKELTGNHHRKVLASDYKRSNEYKTFWTDLAKGESVDGTFEFVTANKDSVFVKGSYSPVIEANGEVDKVLFLGIDITHSKKIEQELRENAELVSAQEEELRQNLEMMETTRIQLEKELKTQQEEAQKEVDRLKKEIEELKKK